jgi:hypothetical protein
MKVYNYWHDWFDMFGFAAEAQCVVTLRMVNFATGHSQSGAESRRMVTEKILALSEAQVAAATSFANGNDPIEMMKSALLPVRRCVRQNRDVSFAPPLELLGRALQSGNRTSGLSRQTTWSFNFIYCC